MFIREQLESDKRRDAESQSRDAALKQIALDFIIQSDRYNYAYQWTWLGLPILQMPQDVMALQEMIWANRPDVIIETGIAWGGSVALYASLLQLIGNGRVVGVDLNLMDHVATRVMSYPFSGRIRLHKGSSIDPSVVTAIKASIEPGESVMVLLDSNHTHDHVLQELRIYAPLVSKGQYLVVSDTYVEDVPTQVHRPRAWGPGNNPRTALHAYLKETDRFEVDIALENKLLLSFMPGGLLRCVK